MTLRKMPFFVWTMLWTSVQILLAIPPLTAALVMVLLDRQLGAHFFDPQNGGSAYLWQHMFWFFGHPEVYILILPVFGMVSEVIPVFSRKVLFGYEFMAAATMAIAFISLGVWAHHMFAVGMSRDARPFLRGRQSARLDSDRHQVLQLAGHDVRRPDCASHSPMLFAFGFLSMFLIGGLTGIMLAVAPFDFQLSDSYFVVGHFHWVLIGGTLFGIFAGIHYWYPKATGRMLSERLARWQFWLLLHRLHPDVRADAHRRHARHAAAHLHLRRRPRLGHLEPAGDDRGVDSGAELTDLRVQPGRLAVERASRPATIPGTPGRWNGRRPRRRRRTTSRKSRRCTAGGRCGI